MGGEYIERKYNFGQAIENNDFKFVLFLNKFVTNIEGDYSFTINSSDALLAYIAKNLAVTVINSSAYTIQISFKDFNGNKSRDVVKAIDSVYLIESLQRKFKAQEQTINFLNEQLGVTERNLGEYENKLENFTRVNKTTSISGEVGRVLAHGEELKTQLAQAKIQMAVLDQLKALMLKNEMCKLPMVFCN
jgi:uncharacterized protein involved in exopolysaccharide biosynthesis